MSQMPIPCSDLGRTLRAWCLNEHSVTADTNSEQAVDVSLPTAQTLQAVLHDTIEDHHGDLIIFEYLIKRRGFQALILNLWKPISPAHLQLSALALLQEANPIFSSESLEKMRAFLEGFSGLDLNHHQPSSLESPRITARSEKINKPANHSDALPADPITTQQQNHSRKQQIFETAVAMARTRGLLAEGIQPDAERSALGLHFYVLRAADRRVLVRLPIYSPEIQALLTSESSRSTRNSAQTVENIIQPAPNPKSGQPQPSPALHQDRLFATAMALATANGWLSKEQQSLVCGGRRGLLRYHLTDRQGRSLAKIQYALLHVNMKH